MERLILSPRTEIFLGKRDFLKGTPKFPNGISEFSFHLLVFTSSGRFGLDPIFQEKVAEMERAHPR